MLGGARAASAGLGGRRAGSARRAAAPGRTSAARPTNESGVRRMPQPQPNLNDSGAIRRAPRRSRVGGAASAALNPGAPADGRPASNPPRPASRPSGPPGKPAPRPPTER